MVEIGGQCQLATNVVTAKDTILGQSIQNIIVYVIIIIFVIVLYTAIVFLIGYKFGFQNGQRKVLIERVTTENDNDSSDPYICPWSEGTKVWISSSYRRMLAIRFSFTIHLRLQD